MEILIVDDEEQILKVIGDFLRDCQHSVTTAGDGAEAMRSLDEGAHQTDLILSDIRMPRMDGLDLLKSVRVRFPAIPVVLMTGHGDEATAAEALQHGARDYLKKPVRLADLLTCIERVEERNQLEAEVVAEYGESRHNEHVASPVSRAAASAEDQLTSSAARVLFVDASQEMRRHATQFLAADIGYLETADSGRRALACVEEGAYDVVFADADLSDMDGFEMVRRMMTIDASLVTVITTAGDVRDTAVRALEAGARGLLAKPFSSRDLKAQLQEALAVRKRLVDTQLLLGDLIHVRSDLQQKVAERERFMSHLIDSAPFGIVSTDTDGCILTFNGKAERMYGYSQREVIGQPISILQADEEGAVSTLAGGPVKTGHWRKDGQRLPVLVHNRDVLDSKGRCIARLIVLEDLTAREQMESQLLQAERLSVLGQLAPHIAHEFKTPLQAILGHAELVRLSLEDGNGKDASRYAREIVPAVGQMQVLVQQMLNLGKPTQSHQENLDLGAELNKLLQALKPLGVLKGCEVETEIDHILPLVYGDPAQIEQAFRNLIVNAAHAMEKSPERRLKLVVRCGANDGTVEVSVCDSGPGIPQDYLELIFQPFFTTKPEGQGTGLGLPIVKTILDRHGATLSVDSSASAGTAFHIVFPASQVTHTSGAEEVAAPDTAASAAAGR